eukprot:9492441-Pyramimonas_sp.AAC.1
MLGVLGDVGRDVGPGVPLARPPEEAARVLSGALAPWRHPAAHRGGICVPLEPDVAKHRVLVGGA